MESILAPQRVAIKPKVSVDHGGRRILMDISYVLFLAVYKSFPYIQNGEDVIYATKLTNLREIPIFRRGARYRVIAFGNSKVLSGFMPVQFNTINSEQVSSYNAALPATQLFEADYFVSVLDWLIERDEIPTHVLLSGSIADSTLIKTPWYADDGHLIDTLFPFHYLPRDLTLFLIRSHSRGGVAQYYHKRANAVDQMIADQGYYFIEGQSHFPGDRLPDNFRLESDTPTKEGHFRTVDVDSRLFKKMVELGRLYNIQFIFVPTYCREPQLAPSHDDAALNELLQEYPNFHVYGPEYIKLANQYFSDITHLNPNGAEQYTAVLQTIFQEAIEENR